MAVRDDLLAATMSQEQMARHLDVDYLQFQTIADLAMAVGPETTCRACFTGEYPTAIAPETLARYGRARQLVHTAPLTTHKG